MKLSNQLFHITSCPPLNKVTQPTNSLSTMKLRYGTSKHTLITVYRRLAMLQKCTLPFHEGAADGNRLLVSSLSHSLVSAEGVAVTAGSLTHVTMANPKSVTPVVVCNSQFSQFTYVSEGWDRQAILPVCTSYMSQSDIVAIGLKHTIHQVVSQSIMLNIPSHHFQPNYLQTERNKVQNFAHTHT